MAEKTGRSRHAFGNLTADLAFLDGEATGEGYAHHDPADRRLGIGCDLNEIKALFLGHPQRLTCGDDTHLSPVIGDHPHFAGPYPVIAPGVTTGSRSYSASLHA